MRLGPSNTEILVHTFKHGLLSKVAHDLILKVTEFTIDVEEEPGGAIQATVDAASLQVVGAVVNGQLSPKTLSRRDKRKIESNIVKEVLHSKRHPDIVFSGRRADESTVVGSLKLHGRSRATEWKLKATDHPNQTQAEFEIHQPDYGIVPFTALLGTLRVKPTVRVVVQPKK